MANLISPSYKNSVLVNQLLAPTEERIIEFKGLNMRTVSEEGEMSDMRNLSTDMYPVLKPRKPRGIMNLPEGIMRPLQIIRRYDKLGVIAIDEKDDPDDPTTVSFWYDGVKITQVNNLTLDSYAVAINNIMCFFPQKWAIDITINGVQAGTYRSLESSETFATAVTVTVSNEDARLTVTHGKFKYDDAIDIHGILKYTPAGGSQTMMTATASCIIEQVIEGVSTDTLVLPRETFIELTGEGAATNPITIESIDANTPCLTRKMPDLDYIVEWNNRLWGCSSAENIIYACKLGNPSNWHYYQGTGLDSFYAQQGTDESWTGIAEYSGHLLFFKPNSITRVYGTAPSNFQVTATKAYGVEPGSSKSILTINDAVFYKSEVGIMIYQGGTPVSISDKLSLDLHNVVAGTEGTKYYASCISGKGSGRKSLLLVFDIARGMWHVEDDYRFTDAIKIGDKIYCVSTATEILYCDDDVLCADDLYCTTDAVVGEVRIINPDTPAESYSDYEWMAVFGPFDEYIEEHKIYSKLALRMKSRGQAEAKIYISIDEGDWELVETYNSVITKGDYIPIIPRRCDRYSIKIEGKGDCEIKSLTRRIRRGTFGRM